MHHVANSGEGPLPCLITLNKITVEGVQNGELMWERKTGSKKEAGKVVLQQLCYNKGLGSHEKYINTFQEQCPSCLETSH